MHIDLITCLPELLESFFSHSIIKRAQQKQKVTIHIHNLRDYATDPHHKVDDYAYGGGAGMVLKIAPIVRCIEILKKKDPYDTIIHMAPDGQKLNQALCNQLSLKKRLMILCGHYKGIDERVRTHFVTQEISVGDYVLSQGELAAAVLTDSIVRLVPGVLTDVTSALTDSFQDQRLAPPVYTRPVNFRGLKVPDVLLSGHAQAIHDWREKQALIRTKARRPSLHQESSQAPDLEG